MKINHLSLFQLSVGYRRRAVFKDINLSAAKCELIALIGRNGVGKSTLMRTIARLQPSISGEIKIAGKLLEQYSRNELAAILSIVSTDTIGVAHLTVKQLVSLGRFPHTNWLGKLTKNDAILVEEAMHLTGITSLGEKNLHEISDGERQRAMIARTLAQDTDMILLDEPTAFLDMPNKYEIVNLLHRLTRTKQKTILFSTHDLNIALQEADKFWLMIDDTMYEGAPEDLALNGQFARMFENTKLDFDDKNAQFNIKRNDKKPIKVAGEGKTFFWTKNALERLGFVVQKTENTKQADISISSENQTLWTINYREKSSQFTSIYQLVEFLKNHENFCISK